MHDRVWQFAYRGRISLGRSLVKPLTLVVAFYFLALAGSAEAEMWCGYGPGTALDHPCQDDNASVDAVLAQYKSEWSAIPGVNGIGSGINQCGYFEEIDVFVKAPSDLPSVRAQIPESIGGVRVTVSPPIEATSLLGVGVAKFTKSVANVPEQPAERSVPAADPTPPKSWGVLREHLLQWMKIPGVVGGGTPSGAVEVSVQPGFMESVRKEIPSSIDGVAIVLTSTKPSGCQ
jgi:hypothetical protein